MFLFFGAMTASFYVRLLFVFSQCTHPQKTNRFDGHNVDFIRFYGASKEPKYDKQKLKLPFFLFPQTRIPAVSIISSCLEYQAFCKIQFTVLTVFTAHAQSPPPVKQQGRPFQSTSSGICPNTNIFAA